MVVYRVIWFLGREKRKELWRGLVQAETSEVMHYRLEDGDATATPLRPPPRIRKIQNGARATEGQSFRECRSPDQDRTR